MTMTHLKFTVSLIATMLLMGCQTQAVKQQSSIADFSNVKQVQRVPALDESIATLDMAEFARRH